MRESALFLGRWGSGWEGLISFGCGCGGVYRDSAVRAEWVSVRDRDRFQKGVYILTSSSIILYWHLRLNRLDAGCLSQADDGIDHALFWVSDSMI
jgi:hypothetical protein